LTGFLVLVVCFNLINPRQMKKSSFILHCDSLEIESELSDEELGKLFRAIIKIQEGEIIELPKHLKLVFSFFKNQFKRDIESYDKIVERNKTNGAKGGRPKKSKPKKTQWVIW